MDKPRRRVKMDKRIPDELRPVCGCGRPMKLARFVMDGGEACLDYWTCTAPARQCPVKNANMPVDIIFDENGRID